MVSSDEAYPIFIDKVTANVLRGIDWAGGLSRSKAPGDPDLFRFIVSEAGLWETYLLLQWNVLARDLRGQ